jgi:hypothetical protein
LQPGDLGNLQKAVRGFSEEAKALGLLAQRRALLLLVEDCLYA